MSTTSATPMTDPLTLVDLRFALSDTERDIQAAVANFLTDRVRPSVPE